MAMDEGPVAGATGEAEPRRLKRGGAASNSVGEGKAEGRDVAAAAGKLARAARVVGFGRLGRVVKSANLLGILIDSHIMANAANAFTTGRG